MFLLLYLLRSATNLSHLRIHINIFSPLLKFVLSIAHLFCHFFFLPFLYFFYDSVASLRLHCFPCRVSLLSYPLILLTYAVFCSCITNSLLRHVFPFFLNFKEWCRFPSLPFFFLLRVSLFSQPRYSAACIIACSFIIIQVSSLSPPFILFKLHWFCSCSSLSLLSVYCQYFVPSVIFFIPVLFCPSLSYHVPHFISTPVILLFLFASRVFSVYRDIHIILPPLYFAPASHSPSPMSPFSVLFIP